MTTRLKDVKITLWYVVHKGYGAIKLHCYEQPRANPKTMDRDTSLLYGAHNMDVLDRYTIMAGESISLEYSGAFTKLLKLNKLNKCVVFGGLIKYLIRICWFRFEYGVGHLAGVAGME